MLVGKLPIPGLPIIWITVGQAQQALARCGWWLFGHLYSHLSSFFSPFSLSLGDGPIVTKILSDFGWLVAFGPNDPLRQYFILYRVVSQREGGRKEKG